MMKKNRGFTLVELMIVITILGIIASIAIPNLRDYLNKSRRSDAKVALLKLQHDQERYRSNNPTYASSPGALGWPAAKSEEQWYDIAITGESVVEYTSTATAVAGGRQTGDTNCKEFILKVDTTNPNGLRESKDSDGNPSTGCW